MHMDGGKQSFCDRATPNLCAGRAFLMALGEKTETYVELQLQREMRIYKRQCKPFRSASDWTKRIELARSLVMSRSVVKVYHPQISGDVYTRHWKSTAHGRKKHRANLTLTHVAIFGKDWKGICNKCMVARMKGAGAQESKRFDALAVFGIFGQCDLWQYVTLRGLDLLRPGQQVYTLKLDRLKGDEAWSHHFVQLFTLRLHHIPLISR